LPKKVEARRKKPKHRRIKEKGEGKMYQEYSKNARGGGEKAKAGKDTKSGG